MEEIFFEKHLKNINHKNMKKIDLKNDFIKKLNQFIHPLNRENIVFCESYVTLFWKWVVRFIS